MSSDDPKNRRKDETGSEMITDDMTVTSDDRNYSDSDRLRAQHLKSLLGDRALKSGPDNEYLLMLQITERSTRLLDSMQKDVGPGSLKVPSEDVICVVGPFPEKKLKEWVEGGMIGSTDRVMKAFDRWKDMSQEFSDWVFKSEGADAEEGDFGSDDRESTLTGVDIKRVSTEPPSVPTKTRPARRSPVATPGDTEARLESGQKAPIGNFLILVTLISVLTGAGIFLFVKPHKGSDLKPVSDAPSVSQPSTADEPFKGAVPESEWPANLRPLKPEDLYKNDSAAMKKIRTLLRNFENGLSYLGEDERATLQRAADPAAASFEVRKTATNLLAAFLYLRQDVAGARKLLEGIKSQDLDPITQINLGLIDVFDRNYELAAEKFLAVAHLKSDYEWIMDALIGLVRAEQKKTEESNNMFRRAALLKPGHPLVYSLWLNALRRADIISSTMMMEVLNKYFWSDQDLLKDAPLPAPVFIPVLLLAANEGLEEASHLVGANLGAGKRQFITWILDRGRMGTGLGDQIDELREKLIQDSDVQSKFLLAYVLKERARFDEAADVVLKALSKISDKSVEGSWPWSFAGELQLQRGYFDQAEQFFKRALKQNTNDAGALNGEAVIARAKGDYTDAERKFEEAAGLDHFFVPAKLRVSRLQWQMSSGRLK